MDESSTSTRSTAELVMDVADDLRLLIRKEIELARVEVLDVIRAQLIGAGLIALAVCALLLSLPFWVFSIAFWLPFSHQVSFAIIASGLTLCMAAGVLIGLRIMRRRRVSIQRSVNSIKEDVRWARDQITR